VSTNTNIGGDVTVSGPARQSSAAAPPAGRRAALARVDGPSSRVATARSAPARRVSFVFLFFSNRLGCLGSLLVSAAVTLIVLLILGVL
jgi:hypothetical protein